MQTSLLLGGSLILVLFTDCAARASDFSSLSLAQAPRSDPQELPDNEDSGAYIGLGFGVASNRYDTAYYSTNDRAYKVFAGFWYNKYFATELSYLNIRNSDGVYVDSTVRLSGVSYVGSAVGQLPIGDHFSMMAKLGYASYNTNSNTKSGSAESHTKSDFSYGVTAAFYLGAHVAIRAEYETVGLSRGVYDIGTMSLVFKF